MHAVERTSNIGTMAVATVLVAMLVCIVSAQQQFPTYQQTFQQQGLVEWSEVYSDGNRQASLATSSNSFHNSNSSDSTDRDKRRWSVPSRKSIIRVRIEWKCDELGCEMHLNDRHSMWPAGISAGNSHQSTRTNDNVSIEDRWWKSRQSAQLSLDGLVGGWIV